MKGKIIMKNEKKTDRYCWSNSVRWNQQGESINIEGFIFPEIFSELFPKFYFVTQKLVSKEEILKEFENYDERILGDFINELIQKKILINEVQGIHELAHSINKSLKERYKESIKYDAEDLKEYKKTVLNRNISEGNNEKIYLNICDNTDKGIINRRTCRVFDENKKISLDNFSKFISYLRQTNAEPVQYCYPSAGGLYPIDIYLCIKENRVEGIEEGIYYYNPKENVITKISSQKVNKHIHYYTNEKIYEMSAFSIMLVYNAECNLPKYSGMGYMFGLIDTGVIVGYLSILAEKLNLGLCSIGDCKFEELSNLLNLSNNQICIHDIEIGIKKED